MLSMAFRALLEWHLRTWSLFLNGACPTSHDGYHNQRFSLFNCLHPEKWTMGGCVLAFNVCQQSTGIQRVPAKYWHSTCTSKVLAFNICGNQIQIHMLILFWARGTRKKRMVCQLYNKLSVVKIYHTLTDYQNFEIYEYCSFHLKAEVCSFIAV